MPTRGGAYPVEAAAYDFWPVVTPQRQQAVIGVSISLGEAGRPDNPERLVEIVSGYLAVALDREAYAAQVLESRVEVASERLKADLLAAGQPRPEDAALDRAVHPAEPAEVRQDPRRQDPRRTADPGRDRDGAAVGDGRQPAGHEPARRRRGGGEDRRRRARRTGGRGPAQRRGGAGRARGGERGQRPGRAAGGRRLAVRNRAGQRAGERRQIRPGRRADPPAQRPEPPAPAGSRWRTRARGSPAPSSRCSRSSRAASAATAARRAPGLGLSIARGFLEAQGGSVEAENLAGGKGARVRLSAPLAKAVAQPA